MANIKWFTNARFGLFIHWGLYSMAARHEWVKNREEISDEDYQKYFDHFNPDLYNPYVWATEAKNAGMKYMVITTKHHEGFCLWDSKYTDYKAPNTPCGKDLLTPMVKAFRKQGLKIGFYHSLLDWHHPEYTVDGHHPQRNSAAFKKQSKKRDITKYARYLHNQTRELLTNFGKIDLMWFDFSGPGKRGKGRDSWQSEKLVKIVRKLQPHILINNRLDLPESADFVTPEQFMPSECLKDENGNPVTWEACQTFSGSWGYHRDESSWKSVDMLVRMLVETVSKGGNLLLNVGPTSRGEFDSRALERLRGMGEWMKRHSRSIYGCIMAPSEFTPPPNTYYTFNKKQKRLYLHFAAWPFKAVHLANLKGKVKYAQLLNDGSEILFRDESIKIHQALNEKTPPNALTLELPEVKPDAVVPVIELFLK
jgi:alpha-L-fucosidase